MKRPVFFFHGFWGTPLDFEFINKSQMQFQSENVDYTNIPELGPEVFLSDWGSTFLNWCDRQFGSESIQAVGYSQGGRLLLHAFEQNPNRFEKLVLISSHPGLQSFSEKETRLKNDRNWARRFRIEDWQNLQVRWNSQPVFQGGIEKLRDEKDFDRETLALCLESWSLAHQPDFRSLLQNFKSKIEVIVGEEDHKYLEIYRTLNVSLKMAKGAAHRVPSDQPSLLVEILKNILV